MERLTERIKSKKMNGHVKCPLEKICNAFDTSREVCISCEVEQYIRVLADYEDLGFTAQQIKEKLNNND